MNYEAGFELKFCFHDQVFAGFVLLPPRMKASIISSRIGFAWRSDKEARTDDRKTVILSWRDDESVVF